MSTVPRALANAGHMVTGCMPRTMLTPTITSLMPTTRSPEQSPTRDGVIAVAVVGAVTVGEEPAVRGCAAGFPVDRRAEIDPARDSHLLVVAERRDAAAAEVPFRGSPGRCRNRSTSGFLNPFALRSAKRRFEARPETVHGGPSFTRVPGGGVR